MGTAGPSGFHSANTHSELLEKPIQIYRLKHAVAETEKGRAGGGWGNGNNEKKKSSRRRREEREERPKQEEKSLKGEKFTLDSFLYSRS